MTSKEDCGKWYVNLSYGDAVVFETQKAAKREQKEFGGEVYEALTHSATAMGLEEWRQFIGREVKTYIKNNPGHDANTPIDLRK